MGNILPIPEIYQVLPIFTILSKLSELAMTRNQNLLHYVTEIVFE